LVGVVPLTRGLLLLAGLLLAAALLLAWLLAGILILLAWILILIAHSDFSFCSFAVGINPSAQNWFQRNSGSESGRAWR
jgi:hypothetical protein